MTLSLTLDGNLHSPKDISTFKEALSFAEDRQNEKPRSDVRLSNFRDSYEVEWRDGGKWMVKTFYMSSRIKALASKK